jgi:3-phenylpropionate/cinnamic acid dioxygenase small subunit
MVVKSYILLFFVVSTFSTAITVSLFAITNHGWASCFVLSIIATILTLENSSLLSDLKQKEEEIELLKALHSDKLLHKVRQLESELNHIKKERERQRLFITNLQLTHRLFKSESI